MSPLCLFVNQHEISVKQIGARFFISMNGKVAVVTGSGSGIGRAIAVRFSKERAAVAVWDTNSVAAMQTIVDKEVSDGYAMASVDDASEEYSIEIILQQIRTQLGHNNHVIASYFL